MSQSLRLPLGIDFNKFDSDMRKVADRIESAGKTASAKVGNAAGDLAGGKLDPGKIKDLVTGIGLRLSAGMADGVRKSSAVMLGFSASIQKMLDKLAGAAVTIFQRIDAAMKFPALNAFFSSAQMKMSNFSAIWRKPLSDLDLAAAGAFGGTMRKVAGMIKAVIDEMAARISGALKSAIAEVLLEFQKIQSTAQGTVPILSQLAAGAKTAAVAPSAAAPIPPRSSVAGWGRRIGFGTQYTAPPPPVQHTRAWGDAALGAIPGGGPEAIAAMKALGVAAQVTGSVLGKVGAATGSVFLRVTNPIMQLRNYLASVGNVGNASFHKMYESHGLLRRALLDLPLAIGQIGAKLVTLPFGIFRKGKQGADDMTKATKATAGAAQTLGQRVRGVGTQVMMALGVFGLIYKVVEFFKDGIKGASDLNETVSKTQVVFGNAFGPVDKQAQSMTKAFGLSHQAQLDVASGFGAMAQGAGMSESASATLSNQMTKMAADLSSSVNIPFEEAGEKIRAALAGEAMPLRQFGANIDEASTKAYALAHHIGTGTGELSQQAAMTARAALVMKGLSYAQGDLERTSDSAANQFRKAGGGFHEFATQIGKIFLPTVNMIATGFNRIMGVVLEFFDRNGATIAHWGQMIMDAMSSAISIVWQFGTTVAAAIGGLFPSAFGLAGGAISTLWHKYTEFYEFMVSGLKSVALNFNLYWKLMQLSAQVGIENMGAGWEALRRNLNRTWIWLGKNWWNLMKDMGSMLLAALDNFGHNIGEFAVAAMNKLKGGDFSPMYNGLLDGFESTCEKFPDMLKPVMKDMGKEGKKLWDEIAMNDYEEAFWGAGSKTATAMKKPGALEETKKGTEYKLAGATEIGSKEAYSALARNSVGGRSTTSAVLEGVKATKDVHGAVKELTDVVRTKGVFDASGAGFDIK